MVEAKHAPDRGDLREEPRDPESESDRARLAHQLNNALAVILGNAQVALHEAKSSPKMAAHLKEILDAGERARDLIRKVLTLPPPPQPAATGSGTHQILSLIHI